MLTSELIKEIKKRSGISKPIIREVLDRFTEIAKEQMMIEGEFIILPRFGKLTNVRRAARPFRNPSTGEKVFKKSRLCPKFSAAKEFKKKMEKIS